MAKKRSDSLVRALLRTSDPLSDQACKTLLSVRRESRPLDFKGSFNPNENGDWCEIIKDLVAMANTDGGYLIVGARDNGSSSGTDLQLVASIDQATVVDKIGKYTDVQPEEVNLRHFAYKDMERVIFQVGKTDAPIVFVRPGTYAVTSKKQKTAFWKGTVYFRHGSKSEPARQADIQRTFDAMLAKRRREMLAGVRKVIHAPSDHQVLVMPKSMRLTTDVNAQGVRLTDDPNAPAVRGFVGSGKYTSDSEELAGVVRGLETDSEAYAAATQLWRFYGHRHHLTDDVEAMRCLLISSMYRHCPPYYWAYRLGATETGKTCQAEGQKDAYPAVHVALRLAFLIGGNAGRRALEHVQASSQYPSARSLATRLLPDLGLLGRVWQEHGSRSVRIRTSSGSKRHTLDPSKVDEAEKLIDEAITAKENRHIVKQLDVLVYGSKLERASRRHDRVL